MKKTTVRKLPSNSKGKDFVVGDLHGCFDLLKRLLYEVEFNYNTDRLFSVGDLVDRGPDSLKCVQLLAESWFFAVKGNHEDTLLDFFELYLSDGHIYHLKDEHDTGIYQLGGAWVKQYFESDKFCMSAEFNQCLSLIADLPLIWVVGDDENRFHVIHAELLRPNHKAVESPVWLNSHIDDWLKIGAIPPAVENRLLWGRTLMSSRFVGQSNAKFQFGLSPTFCGHTYEARPRQALSHICVDTGAFASKDSFDGEDLGTDFGLTMIDVQASSWISASYSRAHFVYGELKIFK